MSMARFTAPRRCFNLFPLYRVNRIVHEANDAVIERDREFNSGSALERMGPRYISILMLLAVLIRCCIR